MKFLLISCLFLATAASAAVPPIAQRMATRHSTTKIAVLFSRQTSFAQLATIRQDLQKDGIELEYQQLTFDKEGGLLKISFHVDCRDGFAGSATSDDLARDDSFGFYRDYTSKTASAFRVGKL
jgi:hypothetical protein